MKILMMLMSCLTLLLGGCVNTNEHGICRDDDMITVYWLLQEDTKIVDFKLTNYILEFEVDSGEQQETHRLPIKWLMRKSEETFELKGMSTLDDLAIFHVVVKHWEAYGSRIDMKFTTYQGADWEDREGGDLTKANFFRSGDKITVYWRSSEKREKRWWPAWEQRTIYVGLPLNGFNFGDWLKEELSFPITGPQEEAIYTGHITAPEITIVYFEVKE